MTNINAEIVEIFSSLQGEGPYAGLPMTFVRFGLCSLRCQYCDTPQGLCRHEMCKVETPPRSEKFIEFPNPVSISKLCELISLFDDDIVSLTGGEPLEQVGFIAEWLSTQAHTGRRFLLETNGVRHEELKLVLPHIHIVGMDLKLPSSTGRKALWDEHLQFLKVAASSGKELYVKIVVTAKTSNQDIESAIATVTKVNKYIPVIIQPASATLTFASPAAEDRINSVERLCLAYLPNVSVIQQMHKEWNVL